MNGGDPLEAWARTKAEHPEPGELVGVGARAARRAGDVPRAPGAHHAAGGRTDHRRADARVLPLVVRQHVDARARSSRKPSRAYYYLTDVDPSWPPERQDEHLRDFNYPTLWSISIHEVYPGHFLHYQHLRHVESKARKSIMFAPASFVEGWAHYCEQMMIEAGFGRQRPQRQARTARRSAHPPRPLHRRHQAARRRHVGGAGRAFLPRRSVHGGSAARGARPSAARSIRPISSTRVGKLMLLKLRQDYKQQQGKAFSLRAFHDTLLGKGTAPFWLHRQLMLGGDSGDLARIEWSNSDAVSTNTNATPAVTASR